MTTMLLEPDSTTTGVTQGYKQAMPARIDRPDTSQMGVERDGWVKDGWVKVQKGVATVYSSRRSDALPSGSDFWDALRAKAENGLNATDDPELTSLIESVAAFQAQNPVSDWQKWAKDLADSCNQYGD